LLIFKSSTTLFREAFFLLSRSFTLTAAANFRQLSGLAVTDWIFRTRSAMNSSERGLTFASRSFYLPSRPSPRSRRRRTSSSRSP
jgi:hypothetical protein